MPNEDSANVSGKGDKQRLEDSRRAARANLDWVFSELRGSQGQTVQIGLLCNKMWSALNWAVEHWLEEPARLGWQDQEARFLRLAPYELQHQYLGVAGAITDLMAHLHGFLGTDDVSEVNIAARALGPWRDKALEWHSQAEGLVNSLTEDAYKATRRIEQGVLRGMPSGLTPCLLLARSEESHGVRRRAGAQAGFFHFGRTGEKGAPSHVSPYTGVVLPLALCRNSSVQRNLLEFALLVASPAAPNSDPASADSGSQRRLDLQSWLDRHELGCLRLVDKEPTHPWVRFELHPETFAEVLGQCNYVTSVADQYGLPTRVSGQAEFDFKSHGELLEWAGVDAKGSGWTKPFALFLATDLARVSDLFSGAWERERMFRPSEYLMRFSTPEASTVSAPARVRLENGGLGRTTLSLRLGEHSVEIDLSEVRDPFPSLLEWLHAVSEGYLPIGFEIDEEVDVKALVAHEFGPSRLLIAVLDRWYGEDFGAAVVDRDQFLSVFRKELSNFLRNPARFDLMDWKSGYGSGDKEPQDYLADLLGHPFLAISSGSES